MKFYRQFILYPLLILTVVALSSFTCKAEVTLQQVDSLDPVIESLKNADQDTLVVFDVDYTLIVPRDLIARPASRDLRRKLNPKIEKEIGQERFTKLLSIARSQGVAELVDARWPQLIKDLQARGIKVIALTAQGHGPFGVIPDEGALRIKELKEVGLDFGAAFLSLEPFLLDIPNPRKDLPLYRDGVILTDHNSKGETLIAFLQKVKWTPKQIIVVDDGEQHLQHIQEALKAHNLNGLLFLYTDKKLAAEKPDPELAQAQLNYLIKHEKWLSDEEVKRLLKEKSQLNP